MPVAKNHGDLVSTKHIISYTSGSEKINYMYSLLAVAVQIHDVIDKNEQFHLYKNTPLRQRFDRGQGVESNYFQSVVCMNMKRYLIICTQKHQFADKMLNEKKVSSR